MFWTLVLVVLLAAFGPRMFSPDAAVSPNPASSSTAGHVPAAAPQPAVPTAPDTSRKVSPDSNSTAGSAMERSAPVRLRIPKIGVDAPFTDLQIEPSGALEAPPADDTNLVGWHASGTSPGEQGTALIAGHLDTATAPAVFARLSELNTGDTFEVTRADGTTAVFLVDSVESFHKNNFPDRRVYDDTPDALVRLITCAGAYDRTAKDYTENLVVFAHLDTTA